MSKIKSSIVDTKNCLNEVFPSFNRLYKDLLPRFWLVDNFSNHFSFYTANHKDTEVKNAHLYTLDKIFDNFLSNINTILIISDTSIKNNVATLILHIHSNQSSYSGPRCWKYHHHYWYFTWCKMYLWSVFPPISTAFHHCILGY